MLPRGYLTDAMAAAMPAGMLVFAGRGVLCEHLCGPAPGGVTTALASPWFEGVWIGSSATPCRAAPRCSPWPVTRRGWRRWSNVLSGAHPETGGVPIAACFFHGLCATRTAVDTLAAVLMLGLRWIFGDRSASRGCSGRATAVFQWVRAGIGPALAESRHPADLPVAGGSIFPWFSPAWRFVSVGRLQFLVESGAFTLLVLLVGRLGARCCGRHHPGVQRQQPGLLPHPSTGPR